MLMHRCVYFFLRNIFLFLPHKTHDLNVSLSSNSVTVPGLVEVIPTMGDTTAVCVGEGGVRGRAQSDDGPQRFAPNVHRKGCAMMCDGDDCLYVWVGICTSK